MSGMIPNSTQFSCNRSFEGQVQAMGSNQTGLNVHAPDPAHLAFNPHLPQQMSQQPSNINPSDPASASIFAYTEKLQQELLKSRWWIMKLAEERSNLLREHNMINVAADAVGKYDNDGNNPNELNEVEFWKALTFASLRELHHRNELTPQSISRIRTSSMANRSAHPPVDNANHGQQGAATENNEEEANVFPRPTSSLPLPSSGEIDLSSFLDLPNSDLFSVPQH